MTRPASAKRSSVPRAASYTKHFARDWEKLSRGGRYDMRQLKEAMLLLIANDAPLGPEWLDHPLKGEWLIIANAISAVIFVDLSNQGEPA